MAEQLEVDLTSLLDAASVVSALVARLPGLSVDDALHRAAASLPGSRLAEVARAEAREWAQESEALRAALAGHAAALVEAARSYRAADDALSGGVPALR